MRNEFPLHDATLDGLVMQGKGCTLFFSRTDGSGCEVLLIGIDALQMNDFREGNIVGYFGTTTRESPPDSAALGRLYISPHPKASAEYQAKYAAYLGRKQSAIVAGKLTLVQMDGAVGANLLATCEHVEFRMRGDGS